MRAIKKDRPAHELACLKSFFHWVLLEGAAQVEMSV